MKKVFLSLMSIFSIMGLVGCGQNIEQVEEKKEEPVVQKKLQIIDEDSISRPIAVQINNHSQARANHAGLQDAYLVYEVIVEGGITRMLAIFKDQTTAKIGSVRSSRPYFLDYALENDAIYVHFGFSEKARQDIASLGVNNINGLYDSAFWRDTTLNVDYEHTAFTNMEKIQSMIATKGYRNTSEAGTVLNYSVDEIDIKEIITDEDGNEIIGNTANSVIIPYSYYMTVRYEYDAENKVYKRFANDVAHTDAITNKQYTFKNIIITNIENYTTNEGKGRQALNNIGSGTGYYITNGCIKKITWEKTSRTSKTIYRYENGEEIKVNDGNTFIQIIPIDSVISYQ